MLDPDPQIPPRPLERSSSKAQAQHRKDLPIRGQQQRGNAVWDRGLRPKEPKGGYGGVGGAGSID